MRKIFINEDIEVFEYDLAEPLLKDRNDLCFFDNVDNGIHKISKERWQLAQKYERKTWMLDNPSAKDDRNHEHFEKFDSFESIKNQLCKKKSIIELGCGPFTNLRLLSESVPDAQMILLDPLINDYINLEHCPYNKGKLNDRKVTLINSSIEEFDPSKYSYEIPAKFDIVVMINVIEHCYDVETIFKKVLQILNNGGIFIFSDVYFDNVRELATNIYDAGHPLRLSESKMSKFLKNFKTIFDQRYHGLYGQEWRNDIYFIGKK